MTNNANDSLKRQYERDGFIVLEDTVSKKARQDMCEEASALCAGQRGDIAGVEALAGLSTEEILNQVISIHFPHKISTCFRDLLHHREIVACLSDLIGPNVKCMQSMFFVKHAGRPGQAWHQDETFIPTRDRSLTGVWIAVDDATVDNGCLWVIPGSHAAGTLWQSRPHSDSRFDHTQESFGFPFDEDDAIPVELEAGSVLLFNGYLLHRSLNNSCESGYRRCYVNHYMSAESWLPWTGGCLEHLVDDYRDIVMVTGEDPYAFKGISDISIPYLRPANRDAKSRLNETINL